MAQRKKSRWLVATAGAVLLILSLAGVVRSLRAEAAQLLYYDSKFGANRPDVATLDERCRRAEALYAPNYYFPLLTAEQAYHARYDAAGQLIPGQVALARHWCERGLELNPYRTELRQLRTRLLELESPEAALAYWRECLDWAYWDPYNHAVMVELYCRVGRFEEALEHLRLIKGMDYYDYASRVYRDALLADMRTGPVSAADRPLELRPTRPRR